MSHRLRTTALTVISQEISNRVSNIVVYLPYPVLVKSYVFFQALEWLTFIKMSLRVAVTTHYEVFV